MFLVVEEEGPKAAQATASSQDAWSPSRMQFGFFLFCDSSSNLFTLQMSEAPVFEFAAFLATTLDGSIAQADGTMDFLDAANATMTPGEDCGIAAFLSSVEAIIMGRHTFIHVLNTAKDSWPYGDVPLYVVSGTLEELPPTSPPSVKLVKFRKVETIVRFLERSWNERLVTENQEQARGERRRIRVYVDGGELVRSFIKEHLLHEITVTVIPKVLGHGRRLLGGTQDVDLVLKDCTHWEFGFVQCRYEFRY